MIVYCNSRHALQLALRLVGRQVSLEFICSSVTSSKMYPADFFRVVILFRPITPMWAGPPGGPFVPVNIYEVVDLDRVFSECLSVTYPLPGQVRCCGEKIPPLKDFMMQFQQEGQ